MEKKEFITRRCAAFLQDGDVVNLGIGMPTMVANYLPADKDIWLQAENGALGVNGSVQPGDPFWDKDLTDAGGAHVTLRPGSYIMDMAASFGLIRGGHVNATILGGFQVDVAGDLANWTVPGQVTVGMGGAMDLAVGAKLVIVAMEHCDKKGNPKIVPQCTLPLTGQGIVDYVVTELCVLHVTPEGLVLEELAPGVTVEELLSKTAAPLIVPEQIGVMVCP